MTLPVLLVHGIDDTGARFETMRRGLEARGIGPLLAIDITPSNASIPFEAMAEQVAEGVRTLQESAAAEQVDIVAYSMGALATRYYLRRLGGESSVRRFVSLSGPHRGTLTALFRWGAGLRQMRPGSALLRDLNADGGEWGGVEVVSLRTPWDLVIVPSTSSVLPGARNRSLGVLLHHWMISDARVIEAVADALER